MATDEIISFSTCIICFEADYKGLLSQLVDEIWGWKNGELLSCDLYFLTSNHLQPVFQSWAYHCWKEKELQT